MLTWGLGKEAVRLIYCGDSLCSLMRTRADFFLEGLIDLEEVASPDRRGVFRQSVASIALAAPGRSPLAGCDPAALARGVRVALADQLFDDLAWLAAPAAALALYEIAGALPQGVEKRELGRRVLGQLYEGDAATFVALATRMAAGAARPLMGAAIRARVTLALNLPSFEEVRVDPLALALIARRELAAEWLGARAVGSLPERRLAARLLERAAREARERARQGDDAALALWERALAREGKKTKDASDGPLEIAWRALLRDRETLVWRHVAAARGLLADVLPEAGAQIRSALSTGLGPTEWRRAATSLAASIAVDPEHALPAALDVFKSPLLERDPGIATAMLWGIPCAAEAEPEAAEELLDALAKRAPLYIAESLAELRPELQHLGQVGRKAAERAAAALGGTLNDVAGEDDVFALGRLILRELSSDRARGTTGVREGSAPIGIELRAALERAVDAFVESGAAKAHALALEALERATEAVSALDAIGLDQHGTPAALVGGRTAQLTWTSSGRAAAATLVRELDVLLLESGVLKNLLLLTRRPSDAAQGVRALTALDERLGRFLLSSESVPQLSEGALPHATLHQRQLRALLHLVDSETGDLEEAPELRTRTHARWIATSRDLLARLSEERASLLRRAIGATVARALDALVREGVADMAEVLLYAADEVVEVGDLRVLSEASMQPDLSRLLAAHAHFVEALERDRDSGAKGVGASSSLAALEALCAELPSGASPRTEALRSALSRLSRALSGVASASSLSVFSDPSSSPLTTLDDALEELRVLTESARRKWEEEEQEAPPSYGGAYPLGLSLRRALQPDADIAAELRPSIIATVRRASASIPHSFAAVLAAVLPRLMGLPRQDPLPESARPKPASVRPEGRLPAWMPSRRTLGGFYVHHQLGKGAAGTVFLVTRIEDRHDPEAEHFALKVPAFDATAARSLSETDFLKLFREEASALLSLPEHPNLARFVTFDAGARPKPILVMELVEGTQCDEMIESRLLSTAMAFEVLDGVLSGLSAMHAAGVGHLDIKPSNVILRDGRQAVLVDFGLAGRHIRPGCATCHYGAPEVWGLGPEGVTTTPMAADMYSFGCFAYEALTGETLFMGPTEMAVISAHLIHDGIPEPVKALASNPRTAGLSELLRWCLRRDPRHRATAEEARMAFAKLGREMAEQRWPLKV